MTHFRFAPARPSVLAFGCIAVACMAPVAVADSDEIDRHIETQLKQHEIPGLALAVVREGNLIKAKGYGVADVELNVPATERSVFQWASVTKQFTATAIMLLVQDGKVNLDDPVS